MEVLTLSERRNIVVIADEVHRSQHAPIDGFARYMRDALPHVSLIGLTGTPIELQDVFMPKSEIQKAGLDDGAARLRRAIE